MIILKEYYIRSILITLLLWGALSANSLRAQAEADFVRSIVEETSTVDSMMTDYMLPQYELPDSVQSFNEDSIAALYAREMEAEEDLYVDRYFESFNPKPIKALWAAALFPGGGQIYNRKYWKLPIIYGGFLGLMYGYNFNQRYFKTYQNAYRDLATNSPNASYLQFIHRPDKVAYAKQNEKYLLETFQRRRNFYRNYRDYCIVGMLGVYLVSIVDAYVDASLYHFDVSPELDACNSPAMVVSYKIDF